MIPRPLLCMKNFGTRSFLKPGRVLLGTFSVLWDKRNPTKEHDVPFYCMKISDTRRILIHKGPPTKIFGTVRQTFGKSWIPFPLILKNYPHRIISETQKGSSTKCFGSVRQKNFDGKSYYSPPPILSMKFSRPDIFWNTEGFPYENFWYF